MPSNFLEADSRFPSLRANKSTDDKFAEVENYLFILLEQLRYTLRNLDAGNFNETGLKEITDPLYVRIEGQLGDLVEIAVTKSGIMARITSAEGKISELQQTAEGFETRVAEVEETTEGLSESVSSISQQADRIATRVSNVETTADSLSTEVSELEQTSEGIETRVASVEQTASGLSSDVSTLKQTASSITTRVASVETTAEGLETDVSELQQTASSLTFSIVQNGNVIEYRLGANGATISSTRSLELYSLTGELPPVGVNAQGVIVNANGQNVLENGWYNTWDSAWAGLGVYFCSSYNSGASWGAVLLKQGVKGADGAPGAPGAPGADGADGLTVMLNNNPFTFAGGTSAAAGGTATVGVLAFLGETRKAATIGTITGQVTGLTTAIYDNGTQNARFVATATTALTTQSGTLTVPITVEGQTVTLLWSWSVAYKGETGAQGAQGPQGPAGADGSDANVTFNNINNALASLFVKTSSGTPTQVSDYKIYSPIIEAATIRASNIYAGEGTGYSSMAANGFEVMNAGGSKKIALGMTAGQNYDVPFLVLGSGSTPSSGDKGLIQKFTHGLWIGESAAIGQETSPVNGTGIFIDFNNDKIYKFINGSSTELGAAIFT